MKLKEYTEEQMSQLVVDAVKSDVWQLGDRC